MSPIPRGVGAAVVVAISVVLVAAIHAADLAFLAARHLSGWLLMAVVVFLAAFSLRKQAPGVPLGAASRWLDLHVYAGVLSLVLFGAHAGLHAPRGAVDVWLTVLFVATALSGIVGLALSRVVPRRLLADANPVLYERIPRVLRNLRREVDDVVLRSARDADSVVIPEFHRTRVAAYVAEPQVLLPGRGGGTTQAASLRADLAAMREAASAAERDMLDDLDVLVRMKGDIDRQYTADTLLKGWLFVHVPLAYGTLLLAAVHALLASAFSSAVP